MELQCRKQLLLCPGNERHSLLPACLFSRISYIRAPPAYSQHVISEMQGGHAGPVHTLQSSGSFLFSGDRVGVIKVGGCLLPFNAVTLHSLYSLNLP